MHLALTVALICFLSGSDNEEVRLPLTLESLLELIEQAYPNSARLGDIIK